MTTSHRSRIKPLQSLAAALIATTFSLSLVSCAAGVDAPAGMPGAIQVKSTAIAVEGPSSSSESPAPAAENEPPADPDGEQASAGTALALLEDIEIKGRAPKTGYDRDLFSSGWLDPDRNGCDARNDQLKRDMTDETFRAGTNGCVVETGTLADPFTATTIHFIKGDSDTLVDIDHLVALSDSWQKGAQQLSEEQREAFANDPLNLLAVDGPANRQKGDSDAATWLPSNKSFRCEYVALQTAVKAKYELWMTSAEHDAIVRVLSTCPNQPASADDGGIAVPIDAAPAERIQSEVEAPGGGDAVDRGVSYENCTAVKAAGAAPIRAGDPG